MSVTKAQLVGGVGISTAENLVVSGIITASSFVGDGSGLTGVGIGTDGSVNTTGIITATSFSGDGSGLSGVDPFDSGTAMLFQQTAAPTGWTKQTTHNDKSLRVVSGTASSGGSTAFTSVFTSRTFSGTVGNTTLTIAQMPSHNHTFNGNTFADGIAGVTFETRGGSSRTTSSTGGGGSHNHSFTGIAADFDVQYVDVIIATKD